MTTILPAAELVKRILGRQQRQADTDYRLLRFCIQCPIEEGTLLYNPMTLELLLLEAGETAEEELIARWFLVPEQQDDRQLAHQVRELAACLQRPVEQVTAYTIFPTTDCNARCYYCFEQGCQRKNMSEDTARQAVRYIADRCGGKGVSLHWFGGEPLLGQKAMDIICRGLKQAGVPYRSSMASNGYLFDDNTLKKAKDLWRLEKVQITLDGTEERYNKAKAFIQPEGSPFRRVLGNIDQLLKAGIPVSVRLNVGEDNWQDLLCLADQLAQRFGGIKEFGVYPNPLYEKNKEGQWVLPEKGDLTEKYLLVRRRLTELNLCSEGRLPKSLQIHHCMAAGDDAVAILPDGSLGCCEHFTDRELFGHIGKKEQDRAMLASWKEPTPPGPECGRCALYPQCFRLKKCPGGRTCTRREREIAEDQLKAKIQKEYSIYKNRQPAQEDTEPPRC